MRVDGVSADLLLVNDLFGLPVNWRDIEAYTRSSAYAEQIAALFFYYAYVMYSHI